MTESQLVAEELAGLRPVLSGKERVRQRIAAAGAEWVGAAEAAQMLCISVHGLYRLVGPALESKSASLRDSATARGVGSLIRRADVERIVDIRRRCRVGIATAGRIYAAIKNGGPL